MNRTETQLKSGVRWIDVSGPAEADLAALATEFDLPGELLRDCLGPKHLPKHEKTGDAAWIIVRWFDSSAGPEETAFREVTHKLVLFWKGDAVLTIHRKRFPFVDELRFATGTTASVSELFLAIFQKAVGSFGPALEEIEDRLEALEGAALEDQLAAATLLSFHHTRNRLSTFKRLFWHTLSAYQKLDIPLDRPLKAMHKDIRERIEQHLFFADELLDDTSSLMNLELSLAAQRTNQVMRILTIFSVFFMPLTFIVGVYGMNFRHMPELEWTYGYGLAWALMVGVTGAIWIWFRKNRWL